MKSILNQTQATYRVHFPKHSEKNGDLKIEGGISGNARLMTGPLDFSNPLEIHRGK